MSRSSMLPHALRAGIGGLMLLAAAAVPAHESGPFSIEVLVDGIPLEQHVARGKRYIEAREGSEYAVRLTNRSAERVAVALSVDGLNSIDARTTATRDGAKWILGPHESVTLEGWQTSGATARRFFFTTEPESYGAWLGRTRNLGIISAAFFREVRPRAVPYSGSRQRMEETPALPQAGKSAPSMRDERGAAAEPAPAEDFAATGIGHEYEHNVRRVHFECEAAPAAVFELRYEYHDALVRLGVLPKPRIWEQDPWARREGAHGFSDTGFAPDPYRAR